MGDYYNRTKSPIPITTQRGSSVSIASKKWATISPEDEGHESLQRAVAKGFLVRARASAPAPVTAAPVAETVPAAEPKLETVSVAPVPRSGRKGR